MQLELNVWTVLIAATLTALATGLGALPFLFVRHMSRWWIAVANALAAGLMLAASHSLVAEGMAISVERTLLGILLGLAGILLGKRLMTARPEAELGQLNGLDARKALLMIGVMTVHSFAEGVGVGVAFGDTSELATFVSAAIALHNIPEGLAISLTLVPRGVPVWQAAAWSIFSSLPQPIMAVPAFLFVTAFAPLLPVGLGLAAGAMIWMVFAELIPEALESADGSTVGTTVTLSFAFFLAFQLLVLKG